MRARKKPPSGNHARDSNAASSSGKAGARSPDEIVADLNTNELDCTALEDPATLAKRKAAWDATVAGNGGIHPNCGIADTRLLHRARHTSVPATRGGGLHPNREVWVRDPRPAERSGFVPRNRHRPGTAKAF